MLEASNNHFLLRRMQMLINILTGQLSPTAALTLQEGNVESWPPQLSDKGQGFCTCSEGFAPLDVLATPRRQVLITKACRGSLAAALMLPGGREGGLA